MVLQSSGEMIDSYITWYVHMHRRLVLKLQNFSLVARLVLCIKNTKDEKEPGNKSSI